MAKTKKRKKPETSPMIQLLDFALENQNLLSKTLAGVRKHGIKANELVAGQVQRDQREALELTKKIASQPNDYSANSSLVLEAAIEAQTRTLEFAQNLYDEQMQAAKLAGESLATMFERSREAAEVTLQFGNWSTRTRFSSATGGPTRTRSPKPGRRAWPLNAASAR